MEARFIGDPRNGGDGPDTITIRGFTFEKNGDFVDVGDDSKFPGHDHFETREGSLDRNVEGQKGAAKAGRGKKAPPAEQVVDEDPRRAELLAQLEGLEVEFDREASTEALEEALDAATAPGED